MILESDAVEGSASCQAARRGPASAAHDADPRREAASLPSSLPFLPALSRSAPMRAARRAPPTMRRKRGVRACARVTLAHPPLSGGIALDPRPGKAEFLNVPFR